MTYASVAASVCLSLLSLWFNLICTWPLVGSHPTRLKVRITLYLSSTEMHIHISTTFSLCSISFVIPTFSIISMEHPLSLGVHLPYLSSLLSARGLGLTNKRVNSAGEVESAVLCWHLSLYSMLASVSIWELLQNTYRRLRPCKSLAGLSPKKPRHRVEAASRSLQHRLHSW